MRLTCTIALFLTANVVFPQYIQDEEVINEKLDPSRMTYLATHRPHAESLSDDAVYKIFKHSFPQSNPDRFRRDRLALYQQPLRKEYPFELNSVLGRSSRETVFGSGSEPNMESLAEHIITNRHKAGTSMQDIVRLKQHQQHAQQISVQGHLVQQHDALRQIAGQSSMKDKMRPQSASQVDIGPQSLQQQQRSLRNQGGQYMQQQDIPTRDNVYQQSIIEQTPENLLQNGMQRSELPQNALPRTGINRQSGLNLTSMSQMGRSLGQKWVDQTSTEVFEIFRRPSPIQQKVIYGRSFSNVESHAVVPSLEWQAVNQANRFYGYEHPNTLQMNGVQTQNHGTLHNVPVTLPESRVIGFDSLKIGEEIPLDSFFLTEPQKRIKSDRLMSLGTKDQHRQPTRLDSVIPQKTPELQRSSALSGHYIGSFNGIQNSEFIQNLLLERPPASSPRPPLVLPQERPVAYVLPHHETERFHGLLNTYWVDNAPKQKTRGVALGEIFQARSMDSGDRAKLKLPDLVNAKQTIVQPGSVDNVQTLDEEPVRIHPVRNSVRWKKAQTMTQPPTEPTADTVTHEQEDSASAFPNYNEMTSRSWPSDSFNPSMPFESLADIPERFSFRPIRPFMEIATQATSELEEITESYFVSRQLITNTITSTTVTEPATGSKSPIPLSADGPTEETSAENIVTSNQRENFQNKTVWIRYRDSDIPKSAIDDGGPYPIIFQDRIPAGVGAKAPPESYSHILPSSTSNSSNTERTTMSMSKDEEKTGQQMTLTTTRTGTENSKEQKTSSKTKGKRESERSRKTKRPKNGANKAQYAALKRA